MTRKSILTAAAATAALATGATAIAQESATPTQVTVGSATQLVAGQTAPFDAAGVRAVRRGKPIPSGYVLVGREVSITYGDQIAWGAGRLTCPAGKTLRTMGLTGQVGPQPGSADYVGRRSWPVIFTGPSAPKGTTVTGTAWGVCR